MKQLLLMLVMLFSSITYAQNFDFACGPTAAEIAAEKAAARTLDLKALSSGTTSVDVSWDSGHVITVDIDVISASEYGHRNYGYHSDTEFGLLLDDVKAAVEYADYLYTELGIKKLGIVDDIKELGTPNITIEYTREAGNVDRFDIIGGDYPYNLRTTLDSPLELKSELQLSTFKTQITGFVNLAQGDYKNNFIGSDSEISATVSESVTQDEKKAIFDALLGKVTSSGKTIGRVIHSQGTNNPGTPNATNYHIVQIYTGSLDGGYDSAFVNESAGEIGSLENMEDVDLIEFYKRVALAAYDL